jgi:hypothetical protein
VSYGDFECLFGELAGEGEGEGKGDLRGGLGGECGGVGKTAELEGDHRESSAAVFTLPSWAADDTDIATCAHSHLVVTALAVASLVLYAASCCCDCRNALFSKEARRAGALEMIAGPLRLGGLGTISGGRLQGKLVRLRISSSSLPTKAGSGL